VAVGADDAGEAIARIERVAGDRDFFSPYGIRSNEI
jgi:hypothetical protein